MLKSFAEICTELTLHNKERAERKEGTSCQLLRCAPPFLRVGATAAPALWFQLPNLIESESPPARLRRISCCLAGSFGVRHGWNGMESGSRLPQRLSFCKVPAAPAHLLHIAKIRALCCISEPLQVLTEVLLQTSFHQGLICLEN